MLVRWKEAIDPVSELGEAVQQIGGDTGNATGFLGGRKSDPGDVKRFPRGGRR